MQVNTDCSDALLHHFVRLSHYDYTSIMSLQAHLPQRVPRSLHLPSQTMLTILLILQIPLVALLSSQQTLSIV